MTSNICVGDANECCVLDWVLLTLRFSLYSIRSSGLPALFLTGACGSKWIEASLAFISSFSKHCFDIVSSVGIPLDSWIFEDDCPTFGGIVGFVWIVEQSPMMIVKNRARDNETLRRCISRRKPTLPKRLLLVVEKMTTCLWDPCIESTVETRISLVVRFDDEFRCGQRLFNVLRILDTWDW